MASLDRSENTRLPSISNLVLHGHARHVDVFKRHLRIGQEDTQVSTQRGER